MNSQRRRLPPVWPVLRVASLIVIAVGMLWYQRLPRYEGRTVWEWFPTFVDPNATSYPALEIENPSPAIVPMLRPLLSNQGMDDGGMCCEPTLWNQFRNNLPTDLGSFLPQQIPFVVRQSYALKLLANAAATPSGARALTNLWMTERGLFENMSQELQAQRLTAESASIIAASVEQRLKNPDDQAAAALLLVKLMVFRPELYRSLREVFENNPVPEPAARKFFREFPANPNPAAEFATCAHWIFANQPAVQTQASTWNVLARLCTNGWDELLDRHLRLVEGEQARSLLGSYTYLLSKRRDLLQVTNAFRVAICVLDQVSAPEPSCKARDNAKTALALLEKLPELSAPAARHITPILLNPHPDIAAAAASSLVAIGPVTPVAISNLLPGLRRAPTAAPLVCLLARYRERAAVAINDLSALANGAVMEGVHAFDLEQVLWIDPVLARKYGLRPPKISWDYRIRSLCGPITSADIFVARDTAFRWGLQLPSGTDGGSDRVVNRAPEFVSLATLAAAALEQICPETAGRPVENP